MKTTITIEIETEGFKPLMTVIDPKTGEELDETTIKTCDDPQEGDVMYSEGDFHKAVLDNILDCFDEWLPERMMDETYPDGWEYLDDCCRKLSIKVNGTPATGYQLHREKQRKTKCTSI